MLPQGNRLPDKDIFGVRRWAGEDHRFAALQQPSAISVYCSQREIRMGRAAQSQATNRFRPMPDSRVRMSDVDHYTSGDIL
jgi:hypothetical protein